MKRLFLSIIILISIAVTAWADNPATCYFPNGKGYVKVYYNRSSGTISISSQTEMNIRFIAELDITVTCIRRFRQPAVRERGENGKIISPAQWVEQQYTICNNRQYINIPVNRTISLSDGLTNPPQDTNIDYYEKFNVTISSPMLSQTNVIEQNSCSPESVNKTAIASSDLPNAKPAESVSAGSITCSVPGNTNNKPIAESKPSVSASAGSTYCSVSGSTNDNIATIRQSKLTSTSNGRVCVEVKLMKYAAEPISILIEVYDGIDVFTGIVKISKNNDFGSVYIDVPEANHPYTAKIAVAKVE